MKAMARLIINKDNCKITKTDLYLIKLELSDGSIYENLEPRRLFPHTNLDNYITIINEDEKEFAFINNINDLDKDSKAALLSCFDAFYMIPKISEVLSIQDKFGALKITVMTERGVIDFRIRNRHNDIKMLRGTRRVLFRDSNDNRYEIQNFDDLDKRSQKLLFSYI